MKFGRALLCCFAAATVLIALPAASQVKPPRITDPVHPAVAEAYDVSADAGAAVDAALKRAGTSGKRVLIDLGGNWCPDCRILAGLIETPQIKAFLSQNFEIVSVDIGRYDKNLDIPARFGVGKPNAAPTILVIAPESGRVINAEQSRDLRDARSMEPQAIVDWLAKWAKQSL